MSRTPARSLGHTPATDNPPQRQAFTKRLWPKGAEVPGGWTLSEELSQVVALSHPDFAVIVEWFEPMWREGKGMEESGQPWASSQDVGAVSGCGALERVQRAGEDTERRLRSVVAR